MPWSDTIQLESSNLLYWRLFLKPLGNHMAPECLLHSFDAADNFTAVGTTLVIGN